MKILIIEDTPFSGTALKTLLEALSNNLQVVNTSSKIVEAIPLLQQHQPELVFFDFELPLKNSFAILEHFNPIPFKIIFITSYEESIIQMFQIAAIDYLLKPLNPQALKEAVDKASAPTFSKLAQPHRIFPKNYTQPESKLPLATIEGYIFIKIADIMYCKADRRYTLFYLKDGSKHITAKNIGKFESILNNHNFMRVHHSQIINLNRIEKILKGKPMEIVLEDGTKVLVSKNRRKALLAFFNLC